MPPSLAHQGLVQFLRDHPALALRLLPPEAGIDPEGPVRDVAAEIVEPVPRELRADLVLLLREGQPEALGVVVEAQLRVDDEKRWTWASYLAGLQQRHRLPFALVVVTPSARVAEWARRVGDRGPGLWLRPWVIGPAEVPAITDPAQAHAAPALAALSAMLHGGGPKGRAVVEAALLATSALDPHQQWVYTALIINALGPAGRANLEAFMRAHTALPAHLNRQLEELLLDLAREKALAEGEARGLERGIARGFEKGIERGIEAGFERGIERGIETGIERGIEQGLRSAIRQAWGARFAGQPLGEALEGALEGAQAPALGAALQVVIGAASAEAARGALAERLA